MTTLNIALTSYCLADGTFIPKFTLHENNGPITNVRSFSYHDSPCSNEEEANKLARNGALEYIHKNYSEGTRYVIK